MRGSDKNALSGLMFLKEVLCDMKKWKIKTWLLEKFSLSGYTKALENKKSDSLFSAFTISTYTSQVFSLDGRKIEK